MRPTEIHGLTPELRHRGSAMTWTIALLALAALAQLALFITLQGRPSTAPKQGTTSENTHATNPPATTTTEILPDSLPPIAPVPAAAHDLMPAATAHAVPSPPLVAIPEAPPSPAPPAQVPSTPPAGQPDPSVLPRDDARVLVSEAIALRRAGDMAGAVAKLNTALDILPAHPRVLFEMAATYEAMGMTEKSAENYRTVADMGAERAGALYPIAEHRLREGAAIPGKDSPADDPLFLGTTEEIRRPGDDGLDITLRLDIHARPGIAIDAAKVLVPVQFFDQIGSKVIPNPAEPANVEWTTAPVDWKEPGIETVEITYHLPNQPATDSAAPGERKYLGYSVELYYHDALLDVLARPRRLARFQVARDPAPPESPGLPDSLPESLPDSLGGPLLDDAPDQP